MTYQEIWQSLEASAPNQRAGYVMRRVKPQAVCDLFLAVAKPSNQHILQMKLTTVPPTVISDLPSARGIDVTMVHSENEQHSFIVQVALKEQRFNQIFDALITDIVDVVSLAQDEAVAFTIFVSRLRHWQRFLEQVGPEGLSREAQQGLYGELWFLRERLIPLVGSYHALLAWVGPNGAHQDFLLQSGAVEVKTTGTKQPQHLIIQSERQLDDSGLAALFLQHLSIDVRDDVGESLVTIVDSLRQLLQTDTVALELYEDRLLEAGFIQSQASKYERTGYNIRSTSLFCVKDGFPRIVEAGLKPGVGSVRYSIVLAACRPFAVTEEALRLQLIGLNHGR